MTEPVPRSLHEHDFKHLEQAIHSLDRMLSERITALDREFSGQLAAVDRRHTELAELRDKAVDAALAAANDKDLAHNDVLGAMKDQQSTFCTKEQAASALARIETLEKHQVADVSKDKGIGMSAAVVMQLLLAATLIISIVVFFANR
jgi:hypothetical protein